MSDADTIAALATPAGRGSVGIIRISGPRTAEIAQAVLHCLPAPRYAHYGPFYDPRGEVLDHGIALYFPAPASYTGEDVLELQGHGGPVVLDMIQQAILDQGARPARPGEFSERAFLNGKLDLAQAEAIADLIDSASQQAARSAQRSLQGEFSSRINSLVERITALRLYVEAAIDFPEEEIDFLADDSVRERLADIDEALNEILESARQGCLLREGMSVVISGRPNAGKSSLLNRLAQRETAIVTDIPGTTRDVLREHITLDGMPLHIIDTAGLRDSADPVEQLGIQRAREEMARADRILLLVDRYADPDTAASVDLIPDEHHAKLTLVHNKIDLTGETPVIREEGGITQILLSAATGAGIGLLSQHLKDCMGYHNLGEGSFMARRRHLDALERAREFISHGQQQLEHHQAGELLAEDLRQAQAALGEITGEVTADDLLGKIFGTFCIGK